MLKITVNENTTLTSESHSNGSFTINDRLYAPDIVEVRDGLFHVISGTESYNAEVISHDPVEKLFRIRVNNNIYRLQVRDKYDLLLKELGMDLLQAKKVLEIKAPMPGLVVDVAVKEGQHIARGEKVVVLEAMKMENILKAPADAVIKKINVTKGNTVEKNEVLVSFE